MKPTDPTPPKAPARQDPPSRNVAVPQGPSSLYDDGVPHHRPGVDDELHNVDVAHEHIDVNLRAVITSAVLVVVTVVVSGALMYFLFGWFEAEARKNDPLLGPLATQPAQMPARTDSPVFSVNVGGPGLLTNEPMALRMQRDDEHKRLENYGWVNEATGVAHIPIGEAKKLLIERGLPTREGAASPHFGVRTPARGEASGGRTITVAPEAAAPQERGQPTAKPHGGH
jgi:hypothetical protein